MKQKKECTYYHIRKIKTNKHFSFEHNQGFLKSTFLNFYFSNKTKEYTYYHIKKIKANKHFSFEHNQGFLKIFFEILIHETNEGVHPLPYKEY